MILQHRCLVLAAIFLASCHRAADGFLVPRHPSGLTKPAVSTRFGNKHFVQLHSSASPSIDAFANNTTLPEPKAKKASREKTYSYKIEEAGRTRTTTYPWSEIQQWALRDNLPRYTIRIPTPEDSDKGDNDNDTLTLASFALWRSLQRDVPELAGYPIGFLRARYEEEDSRKEKPGADDSSGAPCAETTPGVLPYLQNYEFATGGGISGDVYGLQGVSDGTRITTPPLGGIRESLPRGYVQTTDGKASYELGMPLASGAEQQIASGVAGAAAAAADGLADRGARELRSLATASTSLGDNGDGMLVRLGALSGVLLAGATAINMLSHHLTVNVFWV